MRTWRGDRATMWRRRSLGGPGPRSVAHLSAARRIMGHFFTHNNDHSVTHETCTLQLLYRGGRGGLLLPGRAHRHRPGSTEDLHVEIQLGYHRRRYCHARIDFSRKDLGLSLKCDLQTKLGSQRPRRRPNKYEIRSVLLLWVSRFRPNLSVQNTALQNRPDNGGAVARAMCRAMWLRRSFPGNPDDAHSKHLCLKHLC